ncbi:tetratricopeptide repeat protein 27 isoform X2 [Gouania willdenowi]|uniref:Tetratricopeptide repeat protein 27 n=1 Tax=Gouania willdenowi TaxID=441366 RepID=A0A8C5EYT7_GOUWI|nr:tetratricopeptide repeat protein 27 isoform X2 [Gouania willdenowi]
MQLDVEVSVLRGFLTPGEVDKWRQDIYISTEAGSLLNSLMEGDFEGILLSPRVMSLVRADGGCKEEEGIEAYLERCILFYLKNGKEEDQTNRELIILAVAVSCLHLFAQSNWTGPPVSPHICDRLISQTQFLDEAICASLLLDGESIYNLVANSFLLLLARVILTKCSSKMDTLQLFPWWTLRYISLHQQILEACSEQLFTLAQSCMDKVLKCTSVLSKQRKLAIQFHLECVYTCLTYYEYQPAKEHIRKAQEIAGLHIQMIGALGKRTRFQHKYLAQLILDVKRKQDQSDQRDDETSPTPTPQEFLPKDCNLSDDTVLDSLSLAEPDEYKLPNLSAEEQAVILAVCTDFQKNNPVHKLTEEELLSFTSCILSQRKFWAVEVAALSLRTRLEKSQSRCVERAMMQTQKQLASLLTDLGCISSALLMYEKLELWEDAITCYERLGQHGKAEEIVRRELEKKESPSLYCLLGDILKDHQYYDRAWELSGHYSARAMRSKALLHLRNMEYQQCIDCFEQSLKVNSMQLGVWFSLGCAYLALERYEGAVKAFQRCVGLEPENAEAWNNLSTAYIRLQMKNKAFHALQEALRCNYEHWQIWENFIVVSTDIGEFAEVIKAYHRLMDLRDNYKDIQIIQILVRAVLGNIKDRHGQPATALHCKMKELLGRVSSRHCNDAEVWQQYAQLYGGGRSNNPEDDEKALQFLSKAHRCEVQAGALEKDCGHFKEVIQRAVLMGEVTLSCIQRKTNPAESLQMLSSSRLSLRSLVTKAKQMHTDVATGVVHTELQDDIANLEHLISELQKLSTELCNQSQ